MKTDQGSVVLIWLILIAVSSGSGGSSDSSGPWTIWKNLPDGKITFISKADSATGDLYLPDKNCGIQRLTDTPGCHVVYPALPQDETMESSDSPTPRFPDKGVE